MRGIVASRVEKTEFGWMLRPMTSKVSVLSDRVAEWSSGPATVSSSLSKIPYGGFSPVRLQIGFSTATFAHGAVTPTAYTRPQAMHPLPMNSPEGQSPAYAGVRETAAMAHRSRGPWLACGLCCPAGSSLTMASSEALDSTCRLMDSSSGLAGSRDSPLSTARPFFRAVCLTPTNRSVQEIVGPPIVTAAFAII